MRSLCMHAGALAVTPSGSVSARLTVGWEYKNVVDERAHAATPSRGNARATIIIPPQTTKNPPTEGERVYESGYVERG